MRRKFRPQLTYANVISTLCLFLLLTGGSALAAATLAKNSVGSRQLKSKSVTTGKIALNAVNGSRVAKGSLTGEDINLSKLGTVPTAASAISAGNSNTVAGHGASCPAATTLIRGLCYDTSSTEAPNLQAAAEGCAARGGYLPSPMQLYSVKGIINLGTGVGPDKRFTDDVYTENSGGSYYTIVVNGAGALERDEITQPASYNCVYPLVR